MLAGRQIRNAHEKAGDGDPRRSHVLATDPEMSKRELLSASFVNLCVMHCVADSCQGVSGSLTQVMEMKTDTETHKTQLSFAEAVICWQLDALGHHQHEIAAVFKVNQRCVHEVLREKKHVGSRRAAMMKQSA